jgi:hypothetical protein
MAGSPEPTPRWRITGIDQDSGNRVFAPVDLGQTGTTPECFVNAGAVVCITDDTKQATAPAIDGQTGTQVYSLVNR